MITINDECWFLEMFCYDATTDTHTQFDDANISYLAQKGNFVLGRQSNFISTGVDEDDVKVWQMYINHILWAFVGFNAIHQSGYIQTVTWYYQHPTNESSDGDDTLKRYLSYDGVTWVLDEITGSVWMTVGGDEVEARSSVGALPMPFLIADPIMQGTEVPLP